MCDCTVVPLPWQPFPCPLRSLSKLDHVSKAWALLWEQPTDLARVRGLLGIQPLGIVLGAPILLVRSLLEIPALSTSLCAASTSTSSYQEVTEEGTIQDK